MTRKEVLSRIKPYEAELRTTGLTALYLFGSYARDEAGDESDVDISCDLDVKKSFSLLDFVGIQLRLEDIIGIPVDLVERSHLQPTVAKHANRDMVRIF